MTPRLITIPISHFCEKARWALDRAGIDYVERRHLQVWHMLACRRAGGGITAPVLVTDDGVLRHSTAIVRWADRDLPHARRLFPDGPAGEAVAALVRRLDYGLGPDGRLWMYHHLLQHPRLARAYGRDGVPWVESVTFPVFFPVVKHIIRRYLHVRRETAEQAKAAVDRLFDEVAATLADGRPYLTGDRFDAADLTLAALAAPLLMPPQYAVGLPQPDALPEPVRSEVLRWRDHPTGRFALRMYTEHRRRP